MENHRNKLNYNKEKHRMVCHINSIRVLESKDILFGDSPDCCTILLIQNGSGDIAVYEESNIIFQYVISSDSALFVQQGQSFKLTNSTRQVNYIEIKLDIYLIHNRLDLDSSGDESFSAQIITGELPFPKILEFKHELVIFNPLEIISKLVNEPNINRSLLQSLIESLLIQWLDVNKNSQDIVLSSIWAAAIMKAYSEKVFPYLEFSFSDISIFVDNPLQKPNADIVFKALTEHKFIETPKPSKYSYSYHPDNMVYNLHTCDIKLMNADEYKIWFFPEQNPIGVDISSYESTCHIQFSVKSNVACRSFISLYNIPTYHSMTYLFEVKEPNIWQTITIPVTNSFSSSDSSSYVQKALEYIHQNYSSKLVINEIADYVHIHPSYLSALFRTELSQSVNSYIIFYRVLIAKNILTNTNLSIEAVALQTGFYDTQHFSKTFKKHTGLSPSIFRKNAQANKT